MVWITATLASTLIFALVTALDRRILTSHVPSGHAFNVMVGGLQFSISACVFVFTPWVSGHSMDDIAAVAISGAAQGFTLLFMFYALRFLEVSRFMPIYQTFPVVVAVMAIFLLDEGLSFFQWIAVLVTVCGAALITIDRNTTDGKKVVWPAYLLVIATVVTTAVGNVAFKFGVDGMDFWNAMAIRTLVTGAVLMIPLVRVSTFGEVIHTMRRPKDFGLVVFNEGLLVPGAIVLMLTGLKVGPVSLVSTLMATRVLFALLISGVLSFDSIRILDERFSRETLPIKLFSAILIVTGISLLTLS